MPLEVEVGAWKLVKVLGEGIQGKVFLGKHKETGQDAAIKFILKEKLLGDAERHLQTEIASLKALAEGEGHPNVITMFDVDFNSTLPPMDDEDSGGKSAVAMWMEVATGGELFDYLMHTGRFEEKLSRTYFKQIVSALAHCHSHGVTHRDIKAANILLDDQFNIKVADFGLSAKHEGDDGSTIKLKTFCGTRGYMAPEILKGIKYSGPETDIWSIGVLLFIMISGAPPMTQASRGDWYYDRVRYKQMKHFWDAHQRTFSQWPEQAKELINKIFVSDPNERLKLDEIQQHSWLQGDTYTGDALTKQMSQRATKVQEIKDAEARAQAEKKAKRKTRRRRRRGEEQEYDPYAQDVNRGMEEEEENKEAEASVALGDVAVSVDADAAPAATLEQRIFGQLMAPPADIMAAVAAATPVEEENTAAEATAEAPAEAVAAAAAPAEGASA